MASTESAQWVAEWERARLETLVTVVANGYNVLILVLQHSPHYHALVKLAPRSNAAAARAGVEELGTSPRARSSASVRPSPPPPASEVRARRRSPARAHARADSLSHSLSPQLVTLTSVPAAFNLVGRAGPQPAPPPSAPPRFGVREVRAAIPAHCFQRSALTSLWHLAKDLACIAVVGYGATWIRAAPPLAQPALWLGYWALQGTLMTGVWVLAHECGHQSFSPSQALNDSVGWVLHSALLVPYHSWRISHAKHHKNTCSVEHDEVFAAATRSEWASMAEETPLAAAWGLLVTLTFGWPAYLAANAAGPAKYRGVRNSHFDPAAALFADSDKQRWEVAVSDVGFFGALGAIGWAAAVVGPRAVAAYYLVPYLLVNAWLVTITYLQHTAVYVPHFREGEFTWLRGALSTVDRSYGWALDAALHHIADTHVVHHLFHEMPWYHAREATAAVRAVLGEYYLADHTPLFPALWASWRACKFVDDEGGVVYYKNFAKEGGKAQ